MYKKMRCDSYKKQKFQEFAENISKEISDLISQIMCANPTAPCYLNECTIYPGTDNLRKDIYLQNFYKVVWMK